MSAHRELKWGDPVPSKQEVAAEFGIVATAQSLAMLAEVAEVERAVTDDLVAAVRPGTVAHQLESRVKSPQSLARKVSSANAHRSKPLQPEDLLRYTVVTPEPDGLVEAAGATVEALRSKGWQIQSAHHSYVDGSRYKGLHTFLRAHGVVIELQLHSRESIEVKTQTTPLYVVERDPRQVKEARAAARDRCIALSDGMHQPAGIDNLSELGGVPVAVRSYGKARGGPAIRPEAGTPSAEAGTPAAEVGPPARRQVANVEQGKGMSR
jgi:hypothetical protein